MKNNKIIKIIMTAFLIMFSFYYTNKTVEIIRKFDPLMTTLKDSEAKYKEKSVNAKILGNKIIPGKSGKTIDYQKSYTKMKKYGAYNEALTVFKEEKPVISIDDYYDKYVVMGNNEYKTVALIFKVEKNSNPMTIINTIIKEDIPVTLFIDGLFIENNSNYIASLNNFEIELLSYDSKYDEIYFNSTINYLESLTKKDAMYCYSDYDNKEVINLCEKLKLHTILPTIKIDNNYYKEVKEKLSNGSIISMPINNEVEKELSTIISYIKNKGYTFLLLKNLLSEK